MSEKKISVKAKKRMERRQKQWASQTGKHAKKVTIGSSGSPTFRQQVANADAVGMDVLRREYDLIKEKKSNLSARQRALVMWKVDEYKRLGVIQ